MPEIDQLQEVFEMRTKMEAAVLYEAGSPLVVEEVELEGPGRDEVLVRTSACGVCHSDVHQVEGEWAGLGATCPYRAGRSGLRVMNPGTIADEPD